MSERLKRKILHIFFPARCPVCGEVIGYMDRFCSECSDKLENIVDSEEIKGAKSFTTAFAYDENTRPAIMLLKDGICGNADYAMGNELADCLADRGVLERIDMIIPVPMYKSDQSLRGFNQAELIAKVIGRRFHIPVSVGTVIKNRKTKQQKSLDREMRKKNLAGAYSIRKPQNIAGKRVLLVDDVSTTGSTLTELTSLLLLAGASEVSCAACCKTVMNNNF
ncbi:MAG: ComF family protein [Ruminococcus sp.]|nr:ComF family protein [Ruminococcus sp.]